MNFKDYEEQEDMEISEKKDDPACNIYRKLWKTHTRNKKCDTCEIIVYVSNVHQQTKIQTTTLTFSNVHPKTQRYAFVYVNIVHMMLL